MKEALRFNDIHDAISRSKNEHRHDLWHKLWIMNEAPRNDNDDALEPVLVFREPYMSDGKTYEDTTADFKCPRCGCDVGEIYLSNMHIQGDDHFCADCGLRIDWQSTLLRHERRNS